MIERILALMEERRVNAKQLTLDAGLPNSSVTEWKKGRAKPSTDAIIKIAAYFGVTTDWLLTGSEPQRRTLENKREDIAVEFDNFIKGTREKDLAELRRQENADDVIPLIIKDSVAEFERHSQILVWK